MAPVGLGAVLSVHGAATEAQHRRPVRRVVVHREEKVAQHRAVDAVVPSRGRARGSAASLHPHVARHDQVLLVVEVQLAERRVYQVDMEVVRARTAVRGGHVAKNRLAEGTHEGVLVARVGVRDKVGPKFVTERSTHLLGDAPEQPAPAQLCARLRAIMDSLNGWAGWYARRR